LAKSVFQICGLNQARKIVFNRQVSRANLIGELQKHPKALLAMEACGSSNHWCRELSKLGFTVRVIPTQHVKALAQGNKNDANDALAVAESVFRPGIHDVAPKSIEQQDIQTVLRIRSGNKDHRVANANQIRGLLGEYGVVIPLGFATLRRQLPLILEDAENTLTPVSRSAIHSLYLEHLRLCEVIKQFDAQLSGMVEAYPLAKRLLRLRGIGPVTALALYAAVGNASQFKNARQLSAWIGLVPKQYGTGGKVHLSGISKRGNSQLRFLLIHGARAVLNWASKREDQLSTWAKSVAIRRGKHKAIVAVANKTARMVWVALTKGVDALPPHYLSA
jgi:transposase